MHIRSSHLAYGALLTGLGALTVLGTLLSCASKPTIEVELTDPNGLRTTAKYTQLLVFEGGCPPDEDLAYGKIKGAKYLQTTGVDGPFNEIGDLPKDKYGFAALLRQADCAVVAFGCTPVDLAHHRRVTIQVEPVSPPLGACDTTKGESCNNGVCSTATPGDGGPVGDGGGDAGDADVSTTPTCTMEVVAGSVKELGAPSIANANVAGPVAVATDTGFIINYLASNADKTYLVRLPLDANGAPSAQITEELTECPGSSPNQGITAAWNAVGPSGFAGVSWDACGDAGAKLRISSFDSKGGAPDAAPYFKSPPDITRFQAINGSTAKPSEATFLMATLQGGLPKLYTWDGVNVAAASEIPEFSSTASSYIRVTETASIVGIVAEESSIPQFWVGKPNGSLFKEALPAAKTAAVASWGDRALAAVPVDTGITWMVRSSDGNPVKNGKITGGPFQTIGAVALHDSFAIIAAQTKGLKLYRFDGATGSIPVTPSSDTALNLGSTALTTFEGTLMSVVGSGNRVLIVWLNNAGPLGEGKSPGGYALLKCDG